MPEAKLPFLYKKVSQYDLVLLHVNKKAGPQTFDATIEKIYSTEHGIHLSMLGKNFEFVHMPNTWGQVALEPGERAYVFIDLISNRYYECSAAGHLTVEQIEGVEYASFPFQELWNSPDIPDVLKLNCRDDPNRSYASAILARAFENYMRDLMHSIETSKREHQMKSPPSA